MLSLPNDNDETYLQAKEDIRRLVADLIMRTYDSQRTAAGGATKSWDLAMPIVDNAHVQREIKSLTTVEREEFIEGYRRSGLYRPMILSKLQEAGLPSQLSWLPLVESWFKARALSRAGALGLWQFIASTGLRYGLRRDSWIDERLDPDKSTDAAIAYLTELHGLFGDWPKALAGYNCGEVRVQRLQSRSTDQYLDFWDLYELLPRETRRYVPRLLASLLIIDNPSKYGMTLPEPLRPAGEVATVLVERSVKLEDLEKALSLPSQALTSLNTELRYKATPKTPYGLKVPAEKVADAAEAAKSVPEWKRPTPSYVTHRVRRGESLSLIAQRYRSSVTAIRRMNNLRSVHRIYPGQRLRVPVRGRVPVASTPSFDAKEGTHTVHSGESLYTIARRYHTTVARLKGDNNLRSNTIHPGQRLQVRPGSREGTQRYQVRSGDTLGNIASSHGVSLSALLRANGLSRRSTIYPGQWLAIPN
jgi:membrane-bound lytic murein transglycosylase D